MSFSDWVADRLAVGSELVAGSQTAGKIPLFNSKAVGPPDRARYTSVTGDGLIEYWRLAGPRGGGLLLIVSESTLYAAPGAINGAIEQLRGADPKYQYTVAAGAFGTQGRYDGFALHSSRGTQVTVQLPTRIVAVSADVPLNDAALSQIVDQFVDFYA